MWWLWWTSMALAGDPAVDVRSALSSGDVRAARVAIAELDQALGSSREEVSPEMLGFRYQAEGALADLRTREKEMLESFRAAWVVWPTGRPNADVLTRSDLIDSFRAVQGEVFQGAPLDLQWMKLPTHAPVRIDGMPPGSQPIFQGRHHVQVQCADGSWSSRWTQFNRAEDWGHACPDGALAPLVAPGPVSSDPTILDVDGPMDGSSARDTTVPAPPEPKDPEEGPPEDATWYEKGVYWVKNFELPRSPKGRLLMGGPVVGLGTGGELQFVPGGDSGGVFTTLSATHMPFHVGSEGVGVVRLSAGELGVGYQPERAGAVGFEVRAGAAVFHDTLLYTDGYLYLTGAAGVRWDAPGVGRFAFVGAAWVGNYARGFVAPRASIGWQF